ncbi:hypothetical protein KK421_02500 [Clostridioides difficile]|nr:hypothetical protein [Clostridioides difficile]MBT2158082.1 hypothetical protein [Clostridioides difficile]
MEENMRRRILNIIRLSKEHIEECADLFIDVFTKAPGMIHTIPKGR